MRTAEICPNCATYINASCILYDGDYLSVIGVSPLNPLDEILSNINDSFSAQSGAGAPTTQIPLYIGQLYIDTSNEAVWMGFSTTTPNWVSLGGYTTTTTTTSTTSTSTTIL